MGCKQTKSKTKPKGTIGGNVLYYIGGDSTQEVKKNDNDLIIQIIQNDVLAWEKTYPITANISQIIEHFKQDHPELRIDSSTKWLINDAAELDQTRELSYLKIYASRNNEVRLCFRLTGLELPGDLYDSYNDGVGWIGKPFLNPFSLLIFSKSDKALELYPLNDDSVEDHRLNLYKSNGSYCNGNSFLYLSGGEKDFQLEGHVWSINLQTKEIHVTTQAMLPKKQHSMIYIPNSFLFIVGGNSRNVFYYDTVKDIFVDWGVLNYDRLEPALAFIDGKYIYCFSHMKNNLSFERSDLSGESTWSLITPQITSSVTFNQKFFGVAKETDQSLIFIGGTMCNEDYNRKCFSYNVQTNQLDESDIEFREIDLIEKTFLTVNRKWSCLIPNCSLNDLSLLLFNNQTKYVGEFCFEEKTDEYVPKRKLPTLTQSLLVDVSQINLNMPKK